MNTRRTDRRAVMSRFLFRCDARAKRVERCAISKVKRELGGRCAEQEKDSVEFDKKTASFISTFMQPFRDLMQGHLELFDVLLKI